MAHARAPEHCRSPALAPLPCHLESWRLETKKGRKEGRKEREREREREKHHHASFSELWNHAALYSLPLSLSLSLLLRSSPRQWQAGRRVIVHAWIAVVMRAERSRKVSRISYDTALSLTGLCICIYSRESAHEWARYGHQVLAIIIFLIKGVPSANVPK